MELLRRYLARFSLVVIMQYEHFSRHLREKYPTRVHVADQLLDRLKQRDSAKSTDQFLRRNLVRAQREISFPLISYLNQICDDQQHESIQPKKPSEPYLNECLRAAERVKNSRHSERDRRICYENFIMAEKLQSIKKPWETRCRSARLKSSGDRMSVRPARVSLDASSSSSPDDDQATAADVDTSLECGGDSGTSLSPTYRVYQHLNNIDMTMVRDANEQMKSSPARHFSICVLRHHLDSANQGKYAFKKEILQ